MLPQLLLYLYCTAVFHDLITTVLNELLAFNAKMVLQ